MNEHMNGRSSSQPAAPPLIPSSVYAIPDLETLDRINDGSIDGYIYARDRHPNADDLAARLAELHHGTWGEMFASGMGAVAATLLAVVKHGDRVVASDQLYGRSAQLLASELSRFGVSTTFVDTSDIDAVRFALGEPAQALFVETVSNPMLRVADVAALSSAAHDYACPLIVDNTFATPVLARPLEFGADLVVESLTKMIGGHSDLTLGAVIGRDPIRQSRIAQVKSVWGMPAAPFDCWLGLRSLPSLELRMQAATTNAGHLAAWLAGQAGIRRVIYPGLADHPDRQLVESTYPSGVTNMVAVDLSGGRAAVDRFIRNCPGIPFCPSLGDVLTTCSYPAGTSHRYLPEAERQRLGITDGLLRLSVGIEPADRIIAEVSKGL